MYLLMIYFGIGAGMCFQTIFTIEKHWELKAELTYKDFIEIHLRFITFTLFMILLWPLYFILQLINDDNTP